MDDYMFDQSVKSCKIVEEETHYLEIYCSDTQGQYNTVEEGLLPADQFDDFLHRRGAFAAKGILRDFYFSGMRLIIQKDVKHPETFLPYVISLRPEAYVSMVRTLHLPRRCIESSSSLGQFFWSAIESENEEDFLQIIYRKADIRKGGLTRGWEMFLSYEYKTRVTTGFCKGTVSSDIVECLQHLKACAVETTHPMILPVLIFSHDISSKTDVKHREARDRLRDIEYAVQVYTKAGIDSKVSTEVLDLDSMNVDLVECHAQVIWKPPIAYLQIIEAFKEAMQLHREISHNFEELKKVHFSILSRLKFYKRKLLGTENYAKTTLQRLEIQRGVINGLIAQRENLTTQRENRLSFEMAKDQRRIALASKQDSSSMKTISILGIVFLPGTFLASILLTTFFDFYGAPTLAASVSPRFWLFWAVDIPMTLIILGAWLFVERNRARSYRKQEKEIGDNVDDFTNAPMRSLGNEA